MPCLFHIVLFFILVCFYLFCIIFIFWQWFITFLVLFIYLNFLLNSYRQFILSSISIFFLKKQIFFLCSYILEGQGSIYYDISYMVVTGLFYTVWRYLYEIWLYIRGWLWVKVFVWYWPYIYKYDYVLKAKVLKTIIVTCNVSALHLEMANRFGLESACLLFRFGNIW